MLIIAEKLRLSCSSSVLFVALTCSGCTTAEQANQPSSVKVAARPLSRSTPKPTSTRAEKRSEARKQAEAERQSKRQRARKEARSKANADYDVPALLGKDIEQVRRVLGAIEEGNDDDDDGQMSWAKAKGSVLIEYDISSRNVTEFFLSRSDTSPVSNKEELLQMGNLRENHPRYTLEFVPYGEKWMGVKVTPN